MPTVAPIGYPIVRFVDRNGKAAVNGKVYTYLAGSTTLAPTYLDASGLIPNQNPIPLNSRGECAILYDTSYEYKLVPFLADGTQLPTQDNLALGAVASGTQPISAKLFTEVIGDGSHDDTAGLNAFLAATSDGYIPPGNYKITGPLVFRSNQRIRGAGVATVINYVANGPAANTPALSIDYLANCDVGGFQLQVSPNAYPTARALYIGLSTDCHFRNINMVGGGGNAGFIENSTRCSIVDTEVDDYRSNGFMVVSGQDCVIEVSIPHGSGGFMGVQIIYGDGNIVRNCYIAETPDNYFGIHLYRTNTPDIYANDIRNTRREAIALDSGGYGGRIVNNTCRWDTNLGIGDFGISVYGDDANNIVGDYLIDGNTIINSALSGIGIAGWCQRGRVTNNVLRDCAYAGASGFTAGIKVYGYTAGAVADDTVVEGNTISRLFGGMTQGVVEVNELGVCSRTVISNNKTFGVNLGTVYSVQGTGSLIALNDDDLQLHPFVPTVTSQTGTLGSASATLDYQKVGRFIYCLLNVSIPTNGTGNTAINVTLPFVPSGGGLVGFEGVVTGKACKAGISGSNQLSITNFDNSYPGANGAMLELSGILRIN